MDRAALDGVELEHGLRGSGEPVVLVLGSLPNVEPFELPEATHVLHVENPRGMAEALADFFARHPIAAAAGRREHEA
jgi:pimeloyl-ACP methyl ester carboxylesterase